MPKLSPTERAFYKKVGARIRELRHSAEGRVISQSQLARKVGVKPNTVSRWESGEYRPTMLDAQAIARFFDVPVSMLFFESEDQSLTGKITMGLRGLPEKDQLDMLTYLEVRGKIQRAV